VGGDEVNRQEIENNLKLLQSTVKEFGQKLTDEYIAIADNYDLGQNTQADKTARKIVQDILAAWEEHNDASE
jgi:bacterioferritin (cytochrome b1)